MYNNWHHIFSEAVGCLQISYFVRASKPINKQQTGNKTLTFKKLDYRIFFCCLLFISIVYWSNLYIKSHLHDIELTLYVSMSGQSPTYTVSTLKTYKSYIIQQSSVLHIEPSKLWCVNLQNICLPIMLVFILISSVLSGGSSSVKGRSEPSRLWCDSVENFLLDFYGHCVSVTGV